jgi:hypothetical protein
MAGTTPDHDDEAIFTRPVGLSLSKSLIDEALARPSLAAH